MIVFYESSGGSTGGAPGGPAPLLGTLRSNDADGNENVKKTIGFISKTTTLHVHHAFLYISLPVFARLRREHA